MEIENNKGIIGKQSLLHECSPYIMSSASIVGKKEGEGPLGKKFDRVGADDLFGKDNWEAAESYLQEQASVLAIQKANLEKWQIRYAFGGDLLGQSIATSFGIAGLQIPLFGLYGACSTAGESIILGSMAVAGGYAEHALAVTSSHFASAEKQFRFPLEYANQRPLSSTWTVTGSGAFVIGTKRSKVRVKGATIGKIVDYGIKDAMNMGAAMAPSACDTIYQNFIDFNIQPEEYDKIVTGDLGDVGHTILIELMKDKGYDISKQYIDCGMLIYDPETQDTHSGGSGCGCSAVVLSSYVLPKLETGEWKKVLFIPTGALLSTVSFNEGKSVPGIAHAVILEHV